MLNEGPQEKDKNTERWITDLKRKVDELQALIPELHTRPKDTKGRVAGAGLMQLTMEIDRFIKGVNP